MTAGLTLPAPPDALSTLREYRSLAPWGLRDLAALAAGILDASGVVPLNAAARARPTERTIRFYVARNLVSPPDGRGTAAEQRRALYQQASKLISDNAYAPFLFAFAPAQLARGLHGPGLTTKIPPLIVNTGVIWQDVWLAQ